MIDVSALSHADIMLPRWWTLTLLVLLFIDHSEAIFRYLSKRKSKGHGGHGGYGGYGDVDQFYFKSQTYSKDKGKGHGKGYGGYGKSYGGYGKGKHFSKGKGKGHKLKGSYKEICHIVKDGYEDQHKGGYYYCQETFCYLVL